MFPILPALILLLLQGPSNFERLSVDGRLPGALEAIHHRMALPGAQRLTDHEEQALASLIAAGASIDLTRALMSLLWTADETPRLNAPETVAFAQPADYPATSAPPKDGFARSQRTRDGP